MTARPFPPAFRPLRGRQGFTLIELVISIVLLGLLGAVGATMIYDNFILTVMMNASQSSAAKSRSALERVEREIREVGYDPATSSFRTTAAGMAASSFTFTKSDGTTTVAIASGGGSLTLNGATLTDNIDSFSLAYLQIDPATGAVTPTTNPASLRFVEISLTVRDATSGQSIPQLTRIALRNYPG